MAAPRSLHRDSRRAWIAFAVALALGALTGQAWLLLLPLLWSFWALHQNRKQWAPTFPDRPILEEGPFTTDIVLWPLRTDPALLRTLIGWGGVSFMLGVFSPGVMLGSGHVSAEMLGGVVLLIVAGLFCLLVYFLFTLARRQDTHYTTRLRINRQHRLLLVGAGGPRIPLINLIDVRVESGRLVFETVDGEEVLSLPGASPAMMAEAVALLREHAGPRGAFNPDACRERSAMQAALSGVRQQA